jgi:UDP-glucose 4-epimerase
MRNKTILVAGGAGYIGAHVNKILQKTDYQTIVLDNLSRGHEKNVVQGQFIKGNIQDSELLSHIFTNNKIDCVMHFAACIDVGESVIDPAKYYQNNVSATLNLLESMIKHKVLKFVFSSTAAIFGIPQEKVIRESHPKNPISPYGSSKLIVEGMLADFDKAYGLKSCTLRYFNAAGGDPESEIKYCEKKESNLIPIILKSLKSPSGSITIFGTDYETPDGTCIRDYIHVNDLASAHILGMEKLFNENESANYNLGNGHGFSVREVIQAAEKVTGLKVNAINGARRLGDPAYLVANSDKAKEELGWRPKYGALEQMIEHAWLAMR